VFLSKNDIFTVGVGAMSNTSYLAAVLVALAGTCLRQELLPPQGTGGQLALLLSLMSLALLFQHRQQQVGCHAGRQCWQQAGLGSNAGRQQGQQAAEHLN
jgi:hypothetical protein